MNKPVQGTSGTRGKSIADFKSMLFQALARKALRGQGSALLARPDSGNPNMPAPPRPAEGEPKRPGNAAKHGKGVKGQLAVRPEKRGRKRAKLGTGHHHAIVQHQFGPHPRYGEAVPYVRSYIGEQECDCDGARVTSSIRRRLRRAERAMQPAVVDAKASSPAPGTSGTLQPRCSRTTKLGTQCKRPAHGESGLCRWHETVAPEEPVSYAGRGA